MLRRPTAAGNRATGPTRTTERIYVEKSALCLEKNAPTGIRWRAVRLSGYCETRWSGCNDAEKSAVVKFQHIEAACQGGPTPRGRMAWRSTPGRIHREWHDECGTLVPYERRVAPRAQSGPPEGHGGVVRSGCALAGGVVAGHDPHRQLGARTHWRSALLRAHVARADVIARTSGTASGLGSCVLHPACIQDLSAGNRDSAHDRRIRHHAARASVRQSGADRSSAASDSRGGHGAGAEHHAG